MSTKNVFSEDIQKGVVFDVIRFSAVVTVDFLPLYAEYKKNKAFSF